MAVAVPDVEGVPPLDFAADIVLDVLLTADTIGGFGSFGNQQWGIYQGGAPIIVADTILGVEYRQDWQLSNYPQEQGAFASYNKVQVPYDARVRMASGAQRGAMLASIADIAGTTDLYDVVTPDATYPNCNITHYDYRRTASNGVSMIVVDIWLLEVRPLDPNAGNPSTANAKSPSAAPQDNSGLVGTISPSPAQLSAMNAANAAAPAYSP